MTYDINMNGKYEIRVTNPERKQRILEPQQHITSHHMQQNSWTANKHSLLSLLFHFMVYPPSIFP